MVGSSFGEAHLDYAFSSPQILKNSKTIAGTLNSRLTRLTLTKAAGPKDSSPELGPAPG